MDILREFHIGDILTITTGKLLSPRMMDGMYDILNYMTGDNLFTHQLPRAMRECQPWLIEQYPQFKDLVVPEFENPEMYDDFVKRCARKYGETFSVRPLIAHEFIDPIEEAERLVGKDKVMVVSMEEK